MRTGTSEEWELEKGTEKKWGGMEWMLGVRLFLGIKGGVGRGCT